MTDLIAEARFLVDDLKFADTIFGDCLGYERGANRTTMIRYTIPVGSKIVVYDDNEVFRSGPTVMSLFVSKEKLTEINKLLKDKKHSLSENVLSWLLDNGSILNLETEVK